MSLGQISNFIPPCDHLAKWRHLLATDLARAIRALSINANYPRTVDGDTSEDSLPLGILLMDYIQSNRIYTPVQLQKPLTCSPELWTTVIRHWTQRHQILGASESTEGIQHMASIISAAATTISFTRTVDERRTFIGIILRAGLFDWLDICLAHILATHPGVIGKCQTLFKLKGLRELTGSIMLVDLRNILSNLAVTVLGDVPPEFLDLMQAQFPRSYTLAALSKACTGDLDIQRQFPTPAADRHEWDALSWFVTLQEFMFDWEIRCAKRGCREMASGECAQCQCVKYCSMNCLIRCERQYFSLCKGAHRMLQRHE